MPPQIDVFPDVEQLLVSWLGGPDSGVSAYRYCTILPGSITETTVRIEHTSGANRSIRVDRPIVDVDVYALDVADGKLAAKLIAQAILNMRSVRTTDGTVQSARTVIGPRWLPDINPAVYRFGASYELSTHA